MSRSRKKTAGWVEKDTLTKKKFNRSLRRKARQAKVLEDVCEDNTPNIYMSYELGNGNEYRKHHCRWDICDCKWLWYSENEYRTWIQYWRKKYPSFEEPYEWYKQLMK